MGYVNPDGSALVGGDPGQLGPGWTLNAAPAANTQATASRAATTNVRHVVTSIVACLASGTGLAAAAAGTFVIRDGLSGSGLIIWQAQVSIPNVLGQSQVISVDSLAIVGTAGNALTAEFTAAAGAGTLESFTITGYDAQ